MCGWIAALLRELGNAILVAAEFISPQILDYQGDADAAREELWWSSGPVRLEGEVIDHGLVD